MSEASIIFRQFSFEHDGKVWTLDRPSLGTEAAYSTFLEKGAIDRINKHRITLGEQGYTLTLQGMGRDFAKNLYGWMSPAWLESLYVADNIAQLLFLWFAQCGKNQPEQAITEKEMRSLYRERKADLDQLISDMLNDPNPSPR